MHIEKHVLKKLPQVMGDEKNQQYADYVALVLSGTKKTDALKEVFPERAQRAIDRSSNNPRVVNGNLVKEVRMVERTKVVQEMYTLSHKTWWITFLEKKQKMYENLYGIALDESVIPRDRIAASKVLLEHMPQAPQEDVLKVEHSIAGSKEETFQEKLKRMQRELHKQANSKDDVEDAEIIEPEGQSEQTGSGESK